MDSAAREQSGELGIYESFPFPVAQINDDDVLRIQQLEQDLGVVLVAYEGGEG
ncbi:hypothetical protein PaecuDRAFT_0725 [Paenibacillus curdlanolyticus YK9]|uniref:Uncharacterized protein n=1 Tax=Paenibacillus curdlanolyticus YK9 TaxID=717606 RepID=E0I503_9BACL|nr:hypothetical protein [Paenibacillus curdlanolyticus]EFM12045.1 hypothetical protein PaecuDRAFT_0725 [Paenibacillus curdlanolyticus YK9]